ncbi:MAG: GntR family transcriptional regulator [Candidatus Izemoplasmatales bacterium]|jgi:GntR family transcriptional regulator
MKNISLLTTSKDPIYKQLFEQISSQILNRDLPTDYLLPSIRSTAKELRISIITVKKAWEELENNGFIYTIPGKGCFVSNLSKNDIANKSEEMVLEKLQKDFQYYRSISLSKEKLIDYIKKYY